MLFCPKLEVMLNIEDHFLGTTKENPFSIGIASKFKDKMYSLILEK